MSIKFKTYIDKEARSQEKSTTVTSNGIYELVPDNGYLLSKATVTVDVDDPSAGLTATASDILATKTAAVDGIILTGTMPNNGEGSSTLLNASTTSTSVAPGYWTSVNTVSIEVATLSELKTALGL